jgi:hypothetical protein
MIEFHPAGLTGAGTAWHRRLNQRLQKSARLAGAQIVRNTRERFRVRQIGGDDVGPAGEFERERAALDFDRGRQCGQGCVFRPQQRYRQAPGQGLVQERVQA